MLIFLLSSRNTTHFHFLLSYKLNLISPWTILIVLFDNVFWFAFRNQKMFNHSIVTNLQARALLDEIEFRVGIDMLEYSVIGEYTVEANISDTLVFASGESKFTAVPRFLFNPAVYIFIRNYWVNQEGYVSIRNADIRTIYSDSFIGTFPELGASLAEKVTGAYLEIVFPTRLNDWCPLDKYVLTYLQEVLDETTYADIISGGR